MRSWWQDNSALSFKISEVLLSMIFLCYSYSVTSSVVCNFLSSKMFFWSSISCLSVVIKERLASILELKSACILFFSSTAILKLYSRVMSLAWTSTYCLSFSLISLSSFLSIVICYICSSLKTDVLTTVLVTEVVVVAWACAWDWDYDWELICVCYAAAPVLLAVAAVLLVVFLAGSWLFSYLGGICTLRIVN